MDAILLATRVPNTSPKHRKPERHSVVWVTFCVADAATGLRPRWGLVRGAQTPGTKGPHVPTRARARPPGRASPPLPPGRHRGPLPPPFLPRMRPGHLTRTF